MTTSAVIVTYRPGATFARCLESLAGEVDEVVVVDNAGDQVERAGIDRLIVAGRAISASRAAPTSGHARHR